MASELPRPRIHGADHANGVDPIPGVKVESLYLWSSFDDSDANVTVPASGSGGTYNVVYQHMSPAALPSWATATLASTPETVTPFDTIIVTPGFYLIDAWWLFIDDGNVSWLGAQLNLVPSGSVHQNRFYTVTGEVDGTATHSGANDPQNPDFTGQFNEAHTLYVPAGQTGGIYTDLFHNDNWTIDLRANWTLGIHKLNA